MLAQAKSRIRGTLGGPEASAGGKEWEVARAPCLFPPSPCAPQRWPWLWPKLEKAFGTLPFAAATGTSGLVNLPRRALPEGFCSSSRPGKRRQRGSGPGRPPGVSCTHPTLLRIGPFTELGEGARGAAVGLGQLAPSARKQATEKWLTQLQHGASGAGYRVGGVNGRKRGLVTPRRQVARQPGSPEGRTGTRSPRFLCSSAGSLPGPQFPHLYNGNPSGLSRGVVKGGGRVSAHLLPVQGPWARWGLTHRLPGASNAAVPGTLRSPASWPWCRIYPDPGLSPRPRGSRPLFALGRGTCEADVVFPRPPNQRSQIREDAPWRCLLRAGGKCRLQARIAPLGGRAAGPYPPPGERVRLSPGARGWALRVWVCARVRTCVLEGQPHRSALCGEGGGQGGG